ncbi:proline--tRNA ligase [endosymbiont 'TC1' of Trimyema compressum]|uniref:proline--tRNA ligase n=1 Tax=endosymbiont 'TC1' of Trimyema compressum TaxID=243899 RepID=UPI0007F0D1DE|nr:proline--tRNA ligase [endosymbiont 'TC1' of Trimyema compressum]AMP20157.1 proline--tRNA ligase [endosymbiont 'TC1' of Trimyema compressum]
MRVSKLLNKTLKEAPAEAEIPSHSLLIRSGMIRKLSGGIYSYLPLGWRVLQKISNIIREEMNNSGCQELMMPIIQPAELWKESGRWYVYGDELIRFKDRHNRDYCLSPTHEEVITTIVKKETSSYKELPLNLYQIQNKYRDERRPRFGLMRSREFLMKDGYSFDKDNEGLDNSYNDMYSAYSRIFDRCGLSYRAVDADSGAIGGSSSHEFMVLANSGEALIVYCDDCEYASNIESATHKAVTYKMGELQSIEKVATPNVKTIEEVATFLDVKKENLIKTLIYKATYKDNEQLICVLVRGHRDVNEIKLLNQLGALDIALADDEAVKKATGVEPGFLGPINLVNLPLYIDEEVLSVEDGVTGANEKDFHIIHVNGKRDMGQGTVGDYHLISEDDTCPVCGGKIHFARGTEVGQVFKLGTKYSEALDCTYLDENGKAQLMVMGCYGIGVSRTMAASVEQNHDEYGIIWPVAIAPYQVILVPVNMKDDTVVAFAEDLYATLKEKQIDVILDDTTERAGVKFANADLIGYPIRVTIGKKALYESTVDLKVRATGEVMSLGLEEAIGTIESLLKL